MTLFHSPLSIVIRFVLGFAMFAFLSLQVAVAAPLVGTASDSAPSADAQANQRISLSDAMVSSF